MVGINNIELQNMTFNGQEVSTWIHNGIEVFSSGPKVIIEAGTLLLSNLVASTSTSGTRQHASFTGTMGTVTESYTSGSIKTYGVRTSGYWDCTQSHNATANFTLQLDPSLIGKQCTVTFARSYRSRSLGCNFTFKAGSTTLWTQTNSEAGGGAANGKVESKTYTFELTSTTLSGSLSFECRNSEWEPSGIIGITYLSIN